MEFKKILPCIDSRWVAQTFAFRREVTQPERLTDSPMLRGHAYGSVLRDQNGLWRMWYLNEPIYCEYYATSEDGLNWDRPDLRLGLRGPDGKLLDSNALMIYPQQDAQGRWLARTTGPEGFCVLDNEQTPHPAAKSRFTALYLCDMERASGEFSCGLFIAHSKDGIHWQSDANNPVINGWHDTNNMFFYDRRIGRYVLYGRPDCFVERVSHANRIIGRCESEDMVHWTPYRTVLDTDDIDADAMNLIDEAILRAGGSLTDAAQMSTEMTDAEREAAWQKITEGAHTDTRAMIRGRNRQWYGITVVPYAELYLGFAMLYDVPSGKMWLELIHSYDGIDWRRETIRKPWLDFGAGNWDYPMQVPFSSPPVEVGDELWFYYNGDSRQHHDDIIPGAVDQPLIGIGGQKLVRDRWVGYSAGQREAELLTEVIDGSSELTLNARIKGELRVEVCNERGVALRGFELEACEPITGDGTRLEVQWNDKRLSDCEKQQMRLRIVGREATLYALNLGGE